MEKEQQELMMKFQMFEQQIQQIKQQLEAVEQAINELNAIHMGLNDLKGAAGRELMAPVGRGIFAKTKLLEEDLLVDIGEKNLVKKSIPETQKILTDQIEKLNAAQDQLNSNLEEINQEISRVFMEAQKNSKCSCEDHSCGDNCKCKD